VANVLAIIRKGAVGFIGWLGPLIYCSQSGIQYGPNERNNFSGIKGGRSVILKLNYPASGFLIGLSPGGTYPPGISKNVKSPGEK